MLNVLVTLALSTAAMAAPLKPIRGSALYPSASSHEDAKANMAHKHRLSGKQAEAFQQLKEMDLREQVAPSEPAKRARLIVGVQRKDLSDIASQLVYQASVDEANSDSKPAAASTAMPDGKPEGVADKVPHKPEHAQKKRHSHLSSERELQDLRMKLHLSDDKVEEIRSHMDMRKNEKSKAEREDRYAKAKQKFAHQREKDEKELSELEHKMHLPAYKVEQMRQQMVSLRSL